jgi:hypothetical protein
VDSDEVKTGKKNFLIEISLGEGIKDLAIAHNCLLF